MKKWIIASILVGVLVAWWNMAAPREEIRCCIADSIAYHPSTAQNIVAVDQSEKFPAGFETLPLELPAYDDAIFLDDGVTALVTAHDGKIWKIDLARNIAETLVDVPLMAWGIHEAPGNPSYIYFCASGSYKNRPPGEVAGLYRLDISTHSIEPLVLKVPDTKINLQEPVVYADNDANAPEIATDGSGSLVAGLLFATIWKSVKMVVVFIFLSLSIMKMLQQMMQLTKLSRLLPMAVCGAMILSVARHGLLLKVFTLSMVYSMIHIQVLPVKNR